MRWFGRQDKKCLPTSSRGIDPRLVWQLNYTNRGRNGAGAPAVIFRTEQEVRWMNECLIIALPPACCSVRVGFGVLSKHCVETLCVNTF